VSNLRKIITDTFRRQNPYLIALVACIFTVVAYSLLYLLIPFASYQSGLVLAIIISILVGYILGSIITSFNKELSKQLNINKTNNETKTQLIHILSHDIKGPLNNIRQILELLKKDGIDQEEMHDLLNELDNDTARTLKLTNNLVGWIKIQKRNYSPNYELHYIEQLVSQTIELYKRIAEKKNIRVKHIKNEDLSFLTDKEMYKIALRNLISNAVKYSNKGGNVEISYELSDQKLTTYVKDSGVGVSTEKLKSILSSEHLIQSSPGTNQEKGTGIGLHLSKSIIEKLNGKFSAESISGKGSCFYFSLPIVSVSET